MLDYKKGIMRMPVIYWFDKDTIRHLRFPFSFFLLPVFLFAVSQAPDVDLLHAAMVFFILHILVFPSGNGYNSYQDRDETSIGGLKHPPKVSRNLYFATLLFDIIALVLALIVSHVFALMLLLYISMSRLYSYRGVRFKKYPVIGFLTVFVFQGGYVYLMTVMSVSEVPFSEVFTADQFICMVVSSLFIGCMYPITQIYQHEADYKDGVISISFLLGYNGTFVFSGGLFLAGTILLMYYFILTQQYLAVFLFPVILFPVILFLYRWYDKVRRDIIYANFENTMKANLLSSSCMNLFFLIVIINNRIGLM